MNTYAKQGELFTCDWGVNSGFEHLREELDKLIPAQGRCDYPMSKNKHLEKIRRAQNQKSFTYFSKTSWEQWEEKIEKILTPMIIAAAKEQGIK